MRKGATRTMAAKVSVGGFGALVLDPGARGRTRSCGSSGELGSVWYRAAAAVTAVPRLWPRRTVRDTGWLRL